MRFLKPNYRMILLAITLLWRPQILYGIRVYVLFPVQSVLTSPSSFQRASFTEKRSDGCSDEEGCTTEDESEYYSGDESSSDGCSDDACAEPADESSSAPSDGCEDGESCAAETATEDQETIDYEDDGCSCSGEAIVGRPDAGTPIYRTLLIRVSVSQTSDLRLTLQTPAGVVMGSVFSGTANAGDHVFEWNGQTGDGSWIADGSYRCVLDIDRTRTITQSFSYSQTDGFATASANVLTFRVLPRAITHLGPGRPRRG